MAEALVLKEISTGAQNDLERATELVRKIITEFGMSEASLPLAGGRSKSFWAGYCQDRNYSEAVAFSIDKEARRIMDECYNKAKEILTEHMDKLHLVAKTLMEKETLEAEEFRALIEVKEAAGALPEEKEAADDSSVDRSSKREAPGIGGPEPVFRFKNDNEDE